ncbi:Uracil DNA glycosylase superfamily protein [uncultured archaeon]|nr:Uracil DNA glycosylase superfamily protein [uncultured archaeon]
MKDSLSKISKETWNCKKCNLYKNAVHAVPGEGPANAKVFFIGQAPGETEDKTGHPFAGRAGKYLTRMMEDIGLHRDEVFLTSTIKHFPPKNRAPKPEEIKACKPFLLRQLAIVKPEIVVLLGKTAESTKIKAKHVIVTVHPSAAMRFPKMAKQMKKDFQRLKRLL